MLKKIAILMIHGFAGGTYDLEYPQNHLQLNKNFDVYSYTLPGHDRPLSNVNYEDWLNKSEEMIKWLIDNKYTKIYIVAHSMGGVIATYLASKYEQIKKLVLLAPAFNYLNAVGNDLNIKESLVSTTEVIKSYEKGEVVGRVLKLNPMATKEFIDLVQENYDTPKNINCPILLIHGSKDKLVPISSSKYVYNNVKSLEKKLIIINNLKHEMFDGINDTKIYTFIEEFLLKTKIESGIEEI